MTLILCVSLAAAGKSTKKHKDESAILNKKLINKQKPPTPAIIAIEIVDPNENKTSKNSKRTIESSLGYGYQNPAKYEVYKYSQQDIPAYHGGSHLFSQGIKAHNYEIQKSVSYNLPSQTLNSYYQPGNTYYSTVNTHGQASGLSSNQPQEPHVPVIILKVYPSQLNDPSAVLRPNLPHSHPLASVVNSIDVQALLSKYAQHLNQQQEPQYQYQHQQQVEPQYQYQQPQYQQEEYQYQQQYDSYQPQLQTHENYPQDTHTKVIFHKDRKPEISETKTIQIQVPEGAYSSVQVETPEMHYGYSMPGDGSAQQYYYQQQGEVEQMYYYPEMGQVEYQQPEQHQQEQYEDEHVMPYNYHAHQKRSKKVKHAKNRDDQSLNDVIRLDPIKA